ncbi:MAG: leucine-rich repeat domain-containing protein [Solobacterium sp.]|nr:leucine-rich repeat domain-containing protein [Solobacterium sp.]
MNDKIVQDNGRHVFHTDRYGGLTAYEGDGGEVTVPQDLKYIRSEAFAFCTHVTGVVLPEGVEIIAKRAFFRSGIRSIRLPVSLKRIEAYAFAGTPLESIDIPGHDTLLYAMAFSYAESLKHVRLPDGLKSLDPGMFAGCVSLEEPGLPEGLQFIQGSAFLNCTNLKKITLPGSLKSVWNRAFEGCTSLQEVFLPDGMEAVGYEAFKNCTELREARIPEGLKEFGRNAFEGAENVELTGPGAVNGMIMIKDRICCTVPGLKKVIIPEGTEEINVQTVWELKDPEVLDLPRSLVGYYWQALAQFASLKKVVTDRDAQAAEIAYMLDLECTDREGRPFTLKVPERPGEWITEPDGEGGLVIMGCTGKKGHVGDAPYAGVVIPEEIGGKPVTGIGAEAFCDNDDADAFYIPDTVKTIGSRAFAHMGVNKLNEKLFVRMPKDVRIAEDAFEDTGYFTKEDAPRIRQYRKTAEKKEDRTDIPDPHYAQAAADDPMIGTGTGGYSGLSPNIWQYIDRLDREGRVRELTHVFRISGAIDGVGWAHIDIDVDDESAGFRISYIGNSPADFRRFVRDIDNCERAGFGWSAEPGGFPWSIQRRGSILYVSAPEILKGFFLPREQMLDAVRGMTAEWRY